jgi:hypothetical protein
MPTKLIFTKDHTLTVDEDLDAVESAFRGAPPNPAPLAQFTKNGEKILVNVALVRCFQQSKDRSGAAFL